MRNSQRLHALLHVFVATLSFSTALFAATAPITVSVTPAVASVRVGGRLDFDASVANTTNRAVRWAVNDVIGGTAATGTIDSSGLYLAPLTLTATRVTVKAISVADPSKFGSQPVDILNAIPRISSVTPANVNTALPTEITVTGSQFVTGSKIYADGVALTTRFVSTAELRATLTSTLAPGSKSKILIKSPNPGSADSSVREITIWPPVSLKITPETAYVRLSTSVDLKETVSYANDKSLNWFVNGIKGGNASLGTVDASGIYRAPAALPADPTVTVKAVSVQDPTVSDTSTIRLLNALAVVTVAPTSLKTGRNTFTLTGTGFAPSATVQFGGVTLPSVWVSSTRLNVSADLKPPLGGFAVLKVFNPEPGPSSSGALVIPVLPAKAVMTAAAAGRFLEQASWGATPDSLNHLLEVGRETWLNEQFAMPPSTYPDPVDTDQDLRGLQRRFFFNALTGQDQLRQRVAFALSQIFVVSGVELPKYWQMVGLQRTFLDRAFGNYRTLMQEVALSPTMGDYLDMVNNDKPNPVKGYVPNENFARETLQLFSLGLTNLGPTGARLPGSPYNEGDVKQLALAFTGWTYPPQPGFASRWTNRKNYYGQMVAFEEHHDTTNKTLLGTLLPGGRSAQADLDQALDVIFQHPNVGPFVALRLIQKLVTSDPSTDYVGRVVAAFNAAPRGDLKNVIKAILLDPEAGTGPGGTLTSNQGHLREPVLFATTLLRGLGAVPTAEPKLAEHTEDMGQNLFFSPSVFNYFSPLYRIPGAGVPAPEFQILNPTTALARINFVYKVVNNELGSSIRVPIEQFEALAGDGNILVEAINQALMRGEMKPDMKIYVNRGLVVSGDHRVRARNALYLVATQSRFQVQQ